MSISVCDIQGVEKYPQSLIENIIEAVPGLLRTPKPTGDQFEDEKPCPKQKEREAQGACLGRRYGHLGGLEDSIASLKWPAHCGLEWGSSPR